MGILRSSYGDLGFRTNRNRISCILIENRVVFGLNAYHVTPLYLPEYASMSVNVVHALGISQLGDEIKFEE